LILRVHFSRGVSGNVHPYSLCKSRALNGSGVPRKTEFSDVRSERSLGLFIFTGATLSRVGRTTVQFNTKVLGPPIFMSDYISRKNYSPRTGCRCMAPLFVRNFETLRVFARDDGIVIAIRDLRPFRATRSMMRLCHGAFRKFIRLSPLSILSNNRRIMRTRLHRTSSFASRK
jgi:hypothetical protein